MVSPEAKKLNSMEMKKNKMLHEAAAGADAKEDVKVMLFPQENGVSIRLQSKVEALFGEQIKSTVKELLEQYGVESCRVELYDQSALDYTLRARVETAILRATEAEA